MHELYAKDIFSARRKGPGSTQGGDSGRSSIGSLTRGNRARLARTQIIPSSTLDSRGGEHFQLDSTTKTITKHRTTMSRTQAIPDFGPKRHPMADIAENLKGETSGNMEDPEALFDEHEAKATQFPLTNLNKTAPPSIDRKNASMADLEEQRETLEPDARPYVKRRTGDFERKNFIDPIADMRRVSNQLKAVCSQEPPVGQAAEPKPKDKGDKGT